MAVSEAGELKEELKTLKAEYQSCQSRFEEERVRLEGDVTTLGGKLASLEKTSHVDREDKARLEKELRKVRNSAVTLTLTSISKDDYSSGMIRMSIDGVCNCSLIYCNQARGQ